MAAVELADLGQLISTIYDAAFAPELWQEVITSVCRATRAAGGELVNSGILLDRRWVVHEFPETIIHTYVDHYAATDSIIPAVMGRAIREPVVMDFSTTPELRRAPFFEDVVAPSGIKSLCVAALAPPKGHEFEFVALMRTRSQRPFDESAPSLMARLKPHLRRASELQVRLEPSGEPLRAALDGMTAAVVMVDSLGQILLANRAAERLLQARDGLGSKAGRLTGATARETEALNRAVAQAAALMNGQEAAPALLTLHRPSSKAPLLVQVAPLGRENPFMAGGRRATVGVFIEDPERVPVATTDRLRAAFGLTHAEARVALALAEGLSPREMADRFGSSVRTVRTQIETLFAKLGVRRQTQAVQRVLATAAAFAPQDGDDPV